jgi:serine protease AprX
MRALFHHLAACGVLACAASGAASAATLGPALQERLAAARDGDAVGIVVIAFDAGGGLAEPHLQVLRGAGITSGLTLERLAMVAAGATAGQVRALAAHPSVRSIWSNDPLTYYLHQARILTGVARLRTDAALTKANGGLPVSGQGDFSVVINDSGIDGTHADLGYPDRVIQNVLIAADTQTAPGFTPLVALEHVPNTDTHVGHGTHVAGIVGGTGQASGALYQGVAPGARLIGTGSGAGLFVLNALGGFQWALANQFRYHIRVISNSWGSQGPFDPDHPINIATAQAAAQNIVVVFAAGNSGPGPDTHNPYSKAPWVISVAAGTKEGGLAAFSSRGTPAEERSSDGDPANDFDAPTIVAPGTGREFAANSAKFTSDIVSARALTNVVSTGTTDDLAIPPAFLPFYTQISGTSMAAPHVAGVVALMLDADPTLSAEEVTQILRETATPMPGYEEFEVGAGYVNAYAAVDKVFARGRDYGRYLEPAFNLPIETSPLDQEPFVIDYVPQEPGPGSTNTHRFTVEPGVGILDVSIDFGTTTATDESGNAMGLALHAPDGTMYSSPIALPVLDASRRRLRIRRPLSGEWVAEARGVRGVTLGGVPVSGPAGISIPERVDGIVRRFAVTPAPVADLQGHPLQALIERMLADRQTDVLGDGLYHPEAAATRADFAVHLRLSAPLRQTVGASPRFSDVTGATAAIAEAVTAKGSTLRDFTFAPDGLMAASGSTFDPAGRVARLDLAVAFVRALGLDAEARALAGRAVTWNGQPLTDTLDIPSASRGYVQIALDRGVLEAFPAEVRQIAPGQFVVIPGPRFEPATVVTRAVLAEKTDRFIASFRAGP